MTETTTPTEAPTDPVLEAVPGMKEDVTTSLYRAAIGPMCPDFYLPIFSRFEAAGKAGLSWNSAASLLTFNWLLFRQLWLAALSYAGIVATVALLVFGIGRLVFQMSDTVSLVLLLVLGLAAFVVPGLLGNALFHKQCRARMEQALADNPTVAEATSQLQRQASSRLRLLWLALGNVGVLGLAALVYVQVSALTTISAMPPGAAEARQTVSGLATDTSSTPLPGASAARSSVASASEPTPEPALPATSAPALVASAPTGAASGTAVAVPMATAASAAPPPTTAVASETPVAPTAATPPASPKPNATAAKSKTITAPAAPQPVAKAETASAAPAVATSASAAATAKKAAAEAPQQALYYINVGLFSKPENASRVHAQLLEANMPSVMKELKTTKQRQIRVRVGPYATAELAEAAAQKIKAMQFEAGIIQK